MKFPTDTFYNALIDMDPVQSRLRLTDGVSRLLQIYPKLGSPEWNIIGAERLRGASSGSATPLRFFDA